MQFTTRRAFLSSLALLGAAGRVVAAPQRFQVFDGLLFAPMPDLRSALGTAKLLDAGSIWRPKVSHDELDPAGVAAAVAFIRRYTTSYYFDLEEWTVSGAPRPLIDANIRKLAETAQIARTAAPDLKFGFYDQAPRSTYWPVVLNKADALQEWRDINRRSAVVADKVDYLFPGCYTFYDDPKGWELAARAVLQEARQYGKPVYPFLCPWYHDSNVALRGQKVPKSLWRRQLEVCREHADGLVLWGGFKELWDEEADWWVETKAFLGTAGINL